MSQDIINNYRTGDQNDTANNQTLSHPLSHSLSNNTYKSKLSDSENNFACNNSNNNEVSSLSNLGGNNNSTDSAEHLTKQFSEFYNQLSIKNIDAVSSIYSDDIIFIDPLHVIKDIDALKQYFRGLYASVEEIHFDIHDTLVVKDQSVINWQMSLKSAKLNSGKTITLDGITVLKFRDNKIYYHRDYYDMGEMIYQNIPILGRVINLIKKRLLS